MTENWRWLPIWLGGACIAAGAIVIAALFVASGREPTTLSQMPYVVVAGGGGLGLILFGTAACGSHRRRLEQRQIEDAAARMLQAAARVSRAGHGSAGPAPVRGEKGHAPGGHA